MAQLLRRTNTASSRPNTGLPGAADRIPANGRKRLKHKRMSGAHVAILFASTSLFSIIFFLISDIAEATRVPGIGDGFTPTTLNMVSLPLEIPNNFELPDEEIALQASGLDTKPVKKMPKMKWQSITVQRGDTLSKLFKRMRIKTKELRDIVRLGEPTKTLNLISPGEELKFLLINNKLHELIYEINDSSALHITRKGDQFHASTITTELDKRIAHATAEITGSMYEAALEAGIPGSMTMELVGLFDWEFDFVTDVRAGDRFSVIYEEYYLDGEKITNGNILAAEYINNGKLYRAVRYKDQNGHVDYYTPEGISLRKAFLRNPVDSTRVSSKFGKRFHPVLNRLRDHKGVDYAAPVGTPIKASGDGKISHLGHKGGYGNTVIIQHGGKYQTLYAHLVKFKKGLRRGDRVKQGEIIGYIGKTGLATGPHLHYEFRVDGIHRNPLTVKLPGAAPITYEQKTDFKLNTQGYLTLLNTLGKTSVAKL
ncbi:MAG: peptidoglycan DD-metalloendopeptidase family protein [Gammaproteobacteria bacterium]|nr:peptidoglycan DD-metalloendopeptidase family protein [Gammaproteobacteria bacterium]MDH5800855.1 peptidoglycan DD-metalloendopeptidase family protein [Gammaproteobacteria bacterium]